MQTFSDRKSWLEARAKRIGGSDASAIIGMNPYMTNLELWEKKTGRNKPEDISSNPNVIYGTKAENLLRELFRLDYPVYEVGYEENNLFLNTEYPFGHASLDGWLTDNTGRKGILEIKTATILSQAQKSKWDNKVPDNYYVQVLWYMAIYEAEFAILKAQLKYEYGDDVFLITKHYRFERSDVQDDIDYLMKAGAEFSEYIKNDTRPPLLLPEI